MARVLLAHGAPGVIVKLGSRGSRAYGVPGRFDVPPFPANSVDSTGAGDAYVATLIAALLRGDDFKRAIRWASAAGAATVETVGATGNWGAWTDLNEVVERSGEVIP
jgi:sugar/nucleoside kinase (ribokinase family)